MREIHANAIGYPKSGQSPSLPAGVVREGDPTVTVTVEQRNALVPAACLFYMHAADSLDHLDYVEPDVNEYRKARSQIEAWFALYDALDFGGTADVETYRVPVTDDLRPLIASYVAEAGENEYVTPDGVALLEAVLAKIDAAHEVVS